MSPADIRTGKPKVEGRYVVFIQCAAVQARDWVEPIILTWASDRWHTAYAAHKIIGWLGPIPVMKVADIAPVEFDL